MAKNKKNPHKSDLEIYGKEELKDLPTLAQGQFEDLKVEAEHDDVPTRWWLSRMTIEDGERHAVHVEQLVGGRWEEIHKYGRADTYRERLGEENPRASDRALFNRLLNGGR